jgi:hypothetical protein
VGTGLCVHDKQKYVCKECLGNGICIHNKRKTLCKECSGGSLCEHNKDKSKCIECGEGKSICIHKKLKWRCVECFGNSICIHKRRRETCKECKGSGICKHEVIKYYCKECSGNGLCVHSKIKNKCVLCKGSQTCLHLKLKRYCNICDFNGYLSNIVSQRIRTALKKNKELHSLEYIGCDINTLKIHIEKQFETNMSWENYGKWHIDHIIPIKYKENNEEPTLEVTIKRLHYTNLQPLWAFENISKKNKYIGKKL